MADQQIEDLSELTAPASADEILVNDDSDTTDDAGGSPKRMSLATLRLFASELTLDDEYNAGVGNIAKTLVVGKLTPVDLGANNGGTLAANCVITLPSASAGDVCGFFVTRSSSAAGSFAQAPGYCAELANATRINDAAYTSASTGSGKWGLWLPGEMLLFRYLDTGYGSGTAGWYVMYDGRIPHKARVRDGSNATINSAATYDCAWGTVVFDSVGMLATSSIDELQIKRANVYAASASHVTAAAVDDAEYYDLYLKEYPNTTAVIIAQTRAISSAGSLRAGLSLTDYVDAPANYKITASINNGTNTNNALGTGVAQIPRLTVVEML